MVVVMVCAAVALVAVAPVVVLPAVEVVGGLEAAA
jgi:hypothetical protein